MAEGVVRLRIEGMGCEACVTAVDEALRGVPGVEHVTVDLASGLGEVRVQDGLIAADLVAAISKAGYEAVPA